MVTKKDLLIAVLATFCLTSTLFMILPSRSAERDPWADVSGLTVGEPDGKINFRDISYEITHFNQDVSNMTRNVNVTNWPQQYEAEYSSVNASWVGVMWQVEPWPFIIDTRGYSKISLFMYPLNASIYGEFYPNNFTMRIDNLWWSYTDNPYTDNTPLISREMVTNLNVTVHNHYGDYLNSDVLDARLFDVKGPYCLCHLWPEWTNATAYPTGWITLRVGWYLQNE